MREVEGGRGVGDHAAFQRQGQWSAFLQRVHHDVSEREAVHVFHRDEVLALVFAEIVDLRDVRVVEERREAGLVEEELDERAIGRELREDALQDDRFDETLRIRSPVCRTLARGRTPGRTAKVSFAALTEPTMYSS